MTTDTINAPIYPTAGFTSAAPARWPALLTALCGLSLGIDKIWGRGDTLLFSISSTALVCLCLLLLVRLLRHKRIALFVLSLFVIYDVVLPWVLTYCLSISPLTYVLGEFSGNVFVETLKINFLYLCWFVGITFLADMYLSGVEAKNEKQFFYAVVEDNALSSFILLALSALSFVLLRLAVASGPRQEFLLEADTQDRFILSVAINLTILAFSLAMFRQRKLIGLFYPAAILPFVGAILTAVYGFRGTLVSLSLVLMIFYSFHHRIKFYQVVLAFLGGAVLAGLMVVFAYMRRDGVSLNDLFALIAKSKLNTDLVFRFFGAVQQDNLLATNYFLQTKEHLWGITFIDAALNILPHGLRLALFTTIRPQDYILEHFGLIPKIFRDSNATMGATWILEGLINFGAVGPIIVGTMYVVFFSYVEKKRGSSPNMLILYIAVASQAFVAAWYGSSNFAKYVVFLFVLGAAFNWLMKTMGLRFQVAEIKV
jgi:hypothetical protein